MTLPPTFSEVEGVREPMSIYFSSRPEAQRLPLISRNVGVSRLSALNQATPIPWLYVGGDVALLLRCVSLLLAQSRHPTTEFQCPLLGVKRTLCGRAAMSAFDPKRT
jgi:hypothetical protein